MSKQSITQELLRTMFDYRDGALYREGKAVGAIGANGYLLTHIGKQTYRVHRLIFLHQHGYLPPEIDHIDRNKTNNRVENLRSVTRAQNTHNGSTPKNNTSGVKGVYWHKDAKKWHAQCRVAGKTHYLGIFAELDAAAQVVRQFREKHHGEFACHG